MTAFLKRCEEFNGGVPDGDVKDIKAKLDAVIKWLADLLPDPHKSALDLQKYAKLHDRRSYQLLRFAMAAENDFKTVNNAIKEFTKRIKDAPGSSSGILETLTPIIYRSASLVYNRSHNPVILSYSRSDDKGLGTTAQRIINEISEKHPDIFKANVKELSKALSDQAPTATKENDRGSVDTLKALASFAKTNSEQIPRDRKFAQTLIAYALYGSPPRAAKHAVSVLLEISDRKEMHVKDLVTKSANDWEYGKNHFLTKLATLSQLSLLAPSIIEDANDEILNITTKEILLQTRTVASDADPEWQNESVLDEECQAKSWALKILVNRLRTVTDPEVAKKLAVPIFKLLNTLIVNNGELSKQAHTPLPHRNRLRLLAAQLMLKLCTIKIFDELVSPVEFNRLSLVVQDQSPYVRHNFIEKLQKYIVNNKLSSRFLTLIFITAFEPDQNLYSSLVTWIKSRVKVAQAAKSRIFEAVFPRLLHLLAHHPDFSDESSELRDNARYILYYLNTVASEENVALIYKYAERVKQARDALTNASSSNTTSTSDRIYLYSDVAQTLIRIWMEKKGWTMQTWPTKVGLPIGLFAGLPSHEVAQAIAEKSYLPDEMDDVLEELVRHDGKKLKVGDCAV
jgi:sister-chromatid-cohesion protein PDS5